MSAIYHYHETWDEGNQFRPTISYIYEYEHFRAKMPVLFSCISKFIHAITTNDLYIWNRVHPLCMGGENVFLLILQPLLFMDDPCCTQYAWVLTKKIPCNRTSRALFKPRAHFHFYPKIVEGKKSYITNETRRRFAMHSKWYMCCYLILSANIKIYI